MVSVEAQDWAFVFPGQGSQTVGMGRPWAERFPRARETFDEADEVLGMELSKLIWEGPEEELTLTANTQPALLTVSVAILRVLEGSALEPRAVAGHSLGEYSALVAAGVLGFPDALRLVRRRGELMQEAVPPGVGAMAAILHLGSQEVEEVARRAAAETESADGDPRGGAPAVCSVANYNSPGQTVIAGHAGAVARAMELAREAGARRVVELPVSAPFHCALMKPAREAMAEVLAETSFADPRCPVIVNVDAAPAATGDAARDALIRQIDGAVRWVESVEHMIAEQGIQVFAEVGPGNVLTGLVRRIAKDAGAEVDTVSLAQPDEVREALAGYGIHLNTLDES